MVERKHKYLLETARAILFQSKLHVRYWGECILTVTYIINILSTTYLKIKCPFELLYQRKADYLHMRSFGCLCYPTVPKVLRDKFEPRTTLHVFIGYPFGTKEYTVLSLITRKIHISRDLIFHESVFPFAHSSDSSFDSFPIVPSSLPHPACLNDTEYHFSDHVAEVQGFQKSYLMKCHLLHLMRCHLVLSMFHL